VDGNLVVEGQAKEDENWTSVPIQPVNITGGPVAIALNRHYLLKGLRFGLNKLEIENSLSPMVMSNGGKKFVIMPVRMQESAPQTSPQPTTEERNEMPRTARTAAPTPEPVETETRTIKEPEVEIASSNGTNGNGSADKSLVYHVEQIKDALKTVIRDLATVIDVVKAAEKEKRSTEKEIEAIRAKLRQIQSVSI
jgi:hypothetical protein